MGAKVFLRLWFIFENFFVISDKYSHFEQSYMIFLFTFP